MGKLHRLSAVAVKALKDAGRHADGGNLYLSITPTGARRWVFLYRMEGKPREAGLGSAAEGSPLYLTLAQARTRAAAMRALLAEGLDPLAERKKEEAAAKPLTFGECASSLIASKQAGWRNEKHRQQWTNTLTSYCAPIWGTPVGDVNTEGVLQCLQPIWQTKPETASRVRGRIESVLSAAKVRGLRSGENPAQWRSHLDQLLPRAKKLSRGHHPAMAYPDVPAFLTDLRERRGSASLALEWTVLTAARTGETLGASWAEVDTEARVWSIPGDRMKAGRAHRVPLSEAALAVLERAREVRDHDGDDAFLFPGQRRGRPMSNMSLEMVLRRMAVADTATVHGFRSSFRDWCGDTGIAREVAEVCLAHAVADQTERAYARSDLIERRRPVMEAWARHCAGEAEGKVIPLRAGTRAG
jgi:integrase